MVLYNKTSCGNKDLFKCYIRYRHKDGAFPPLNVKLLQLTGYAKQFKLINFLVVDKELLQ